MRVILDTNIFISALLSGSSAPARLLAQWRQGRFTLLSCEEQLEEMRRVTRYPKIRERLPPALAGRLINDLRGLTEMIVDLPEVDVSKDRWDNYLLAMAQAGRAEFLVTGDKADLLGRCRHAGTTIVTVSKMLERLG